MCIMAVSAEPSRKKAYSPDLRWRMVFQRIAMELPYEKIAQNLNVAVSTVHRTYKHFEVTGEVDPQPCDEPRYDLRALDPARELYIIGLVLENPSIYLDEVCGIIKEVFTLDVSVSTICRLLRKHGFTRKKIRQVAMQRSEQFRGAFVAQCMLYKRDMFVWVDETGSDARSHIRKFGYALRGLTPTTHRVLSRGQRVNAIAAMSTTGVTAFELTKHTVTEDNFFDFARGTLIPHMNAYDGVQPKSVVVMDNLTVHHVDALTDLFRSSGIVLLYLPPYSPDRNPIEELFSYIKNYLRRHDELLQALQDPTVVIQEAFASVNADQCNGWITHAGYPE